MKRILMSIFSCAIAASASVTILSGDGNDNRVRVILTGDGYTASQESQFIADAQSVFTKMKSETFFAQFLGALNVYAAFSASAQSGADHPLQGVSVSTAFDGTFGSTSSLERLVTVNGTKVKTYLSSAFSNYDANYDITLVIVNDPQYGGSGGQIATTTTNGSGPAVALHEIGHSYGKLTDEYDYQPEYSPGERPNSTAETNRSAIKWNVWIDASTPIPTPETSDYSSKVGLFEGACYRTTGWYRPWNECAMKSLGHFCPVCNEEFTTVSYKQVTPIDAVSPSAGSTVNGSQQGLLKVTTLPLSKKPQVTWVVNGTALSQRGDSLVLADAGLNIGSNSVKAYVKDNSGLVRISSHFAYISDTVSWTVNWAGSVVDSVTLAVSSSHGTVTKSPNAVKYPKGTTVTLTALAESGYRFGSWGGDLSGSESVKTILLDGSKTVTASFDPIVIAENDLMTHAAWEVIWSGVDGTTASLDTSKLASENSVSASCAVAKDPTYASYSSLIGSFENSFAGVTSFDITYASSKAFAFELYDQGDTVTPIYVVLPAHPSSATLSIPVSSLTKREDWGAVVNTPLDLSKVFTLTFSVIDPDNEDIASAGSSGTITINGLVANGYDATPALNRSASAGTFNATVFANELHLSMPNASPLSLSVTALNGRTLYRIDNRHLAAGEHVLPLPLMASGVYILRAACSAGTVSHRIIMDR